MKNIFAQLELRFGLIRETTPKYTQYQYKELSLQADNTPAGESIRKASKKAKTWTHIDVDAASRVKNVPRGTIIAKLNDWNERGYLMIYWIVCKVIIPWLSLRTHIPVSCPSATRRGLCPCTVDISIFIAFQTLPSPSIRA